MPRAPPCGPGVLTPPILSFPDIPLQPASNVCGKGDSTGMGICSTGSSMVTTIGRTLLVTLFVLAGSLAGCRAPAPSSPTPPAPVSTSRPAPQTVTTQAGQSGPPILPDPKLTPGA